MASREQWAQWVRGWQRSGLTAAEYAAEEGIHPGTLTHWKWKLSREARDRREPTPVAESASFVERRPASLVVARITKPKFVRKDRDERTGVLMGETPELPIPRGLAGPGCWPTRW